jgi:hypothetical protein
MDEHLLDCSAWQAMLERENIPAADAYVGVLNKADFAARRGRLLVWRGTTDGVHISLREYSGEPDADVAMLLATDAEGMGLVFPKH